MKMILAMAKNNGVIGYENKLPWNIKEDMNWFKLHTANQAVLMGRKTWESLGCTPLPKRDNIIMSNKLLDLPAGVALISTDTQIRFLNKYYKEHGKELFIIGGKSLYEKYAEDCDEVIITLVSRKDGKEIQGDVKLNNFIKSHDLRLLTIIKQESADGIYNLEFCTFVPQK